jgi:hypothetical protein
MQSQNSRWPLTPLVPKLLIVGGFLYALAAYLYMFRYWGQ